MRTTACLMALLMSCFASHVRAAGDEFSSSRTLPPKGTSDIRQPGTLSGGETIATATPITALPFLDGASTCGLINNYDPFCVPEVHVAPDVVYSFTPTSDMCVNISLCGSNYDTEIVVYQNNVGTPIACQDDSPYCGLQSHLEAVPLTAGNTYYIVIDGYFDACGVYRLYVEQCPPPPVCDPCPPLAVLEGEPVCTNGYQDNFNSGCNSTPQRFTPLPCGPGVTICGTYGTFDGNISRDTDWYQFTVHTPTTIQATVQGRGLTGTALGILDTACPPTLLCARLDPTAECATLSCSAAVAPGTYRIAVATLFDGTPCGSPYTLSVSGITCSPTAVRTSSWGTLKGIYR